jgi:hypothetical protein
VNGTLASYGAVGGVAARRSEDPAARAVAYGYCVDPLLKGPGVLAYESGLVQPGEQPGA